MITGPFAFAIGTEATDVVTLGPAELELGPDAFGGGGPGTGTEDGTAPASKSTQ